ncbi:MAG: ABC transporter ATP-binding protein [Oscillospiraceae bacterium]|jgi:peptide/nickel transport system ATP-binding protein|nr:ABC transporter ATP-binding protein [Oscillospiraceae bacterium]
MSLLTIEHVNIRYANKGKSILACDDVSLSLDAQDSIGIVGESGSGKSTLAMGILGLLPQSAALEGSIRFQGQNLPELSPQALGELRWTQLSAVFQKSMNGLSPVHRIGKQMASIYRVHRPKATGDECRARIRELLAKVNLPGRVADLYPHQLSGGMMQRVSIALSLMFSPALIILDEATTALDVVTESQILKELTRLQESEQVARLMITHNMAVVATSCRQVAVMYAGRVMEAGRTADVLPNPRHPYTRGLLRSFPSFTGEKRNLRGIPGTLPDLSSPVSGCAFAPRCEFAQARCHSERPPLHTDESGWQTACFFAEGGQA